jgi:hypothetical protein
MKQPESRNTQDEETDKCIQHLQGILKQQHRTIEDPIGQHTTANNNGTINQQNAPIRQ